MAVFQDTSWQHLARQPLVQQCLVRQFYFQIIRLYNYRGRGYVSGHLTATFGSAILGVETFSVATLGAATFGVWQFYFQFRLYNYHGCSCVSGHLICKSCQVSRLNFLFCSKYRHQLDISLVADLSISIYFVTFVIVLWRYVNALYRCVIAIYGY
jgi:hypothetical protein